MASSYLSSVIKQFQYYKLLGDQCMMQLEEGQLFWQANEESNSIAIIVKHMWGNMLSRWTDFRTADGEKEWRNRDAEFVGDIANREELLLKWEEGWNVLFKTLESLGEEELEMIIYIRNEGHTAVEAINRQLSHYSYHVGQMVVIAKMLTANDWQSLSIPKGDSTKFNAEKFAKEKGKRHFTDS